MRDDHPTLTVLLRSTQYQSMFPRGAAPEPTLQHQQPLPVVSCVHYASAHPLPLSRTSNLSTARDGSSGLFPQSHSYPPTSFPAPASPPLSRLLSQQHAGVSSQNQQWCRKRLHIPAGFQVPAFHLPPRLLTLHCSLATHFPDWHLDHSSPHLS